MIILLQPEQVATFWDAIKHGLVIANRVPKVNQQVYLNTILERLLIGKAQAWVGFTEQDGERTFHAYGITTIQEDSLTGEKHLYLHTLYAFRPIPDALLQSMVPELEKYARTIGCTLLTTLTANARLQEYYQSQGFTQNTEFYQKRI